MDYLFLAFTNPEDGREADFNAWYDTHHVREVLRYGRGFLNGRRYVRSPDSRVDFPWKYLALYTLTTDDLRGYHEAPWTSSQPPLTPFRGLLRDDHAAYVYEADVPDQSSHGANEAIRGLSDQADALVVELTRSGANRTAPEPEHTIRPQQFVLARHQRQTQPKSTWSRLTVYSLTRQHVDRLDAVTAAICQREAADVVRPKEERCVSAWRAISPLYRAV